MIVSYYRVIVNGIEKYFGRDLPVDEDGKPLRPTKTVTIERIATCIKCCKWTPYCEVFAYGRCEDCSAQFMPLTKRTLKNVSLNPDGQRKPTTVGNRR